MIKELTELGPYMDFIGGFAADPDYSEPMISTEENFRCNLLRALERPDDRVLGVFEDGAMTGLFVFEILEEDRYAEMLVGLSRSETADYEIADWLRANIPGYRADFVFNPRNDKLVSMLKTLGAEFEPEQQRMCLADAGVSGDTEGIEPLSDRYNEQYVAIHSRDCYWTGERIVAEGDIFSVLLAVDNGTAVGYIDFTHGWDENEIFDLQVNEDHRRKGWGRKLVIKAIEMNRPNGLMLMADVDNAAALALYEALGFVKIEGQNSRMASWTVG